MRVQRIRDTSNCSFYELVDDTGQPIPVVSQFLRYIGSRGCSPNTVSAYAYDLLHFTRFLNAQGWNYDDFTPGRSIRLLEYLHNIQSQRPTRSAGPVLAVSAGKPVRRLAPASINRVLAAVSSFYEYLILSEHWKAGPNPMLKKFDSEAARVPDRHHPFMGRASRQQPIRRVLRVRTIRRVPRPMDGTQVSQLIEELKLRRDKVMTLLMLNGGLRPGEVLNLHLEDIQYGRCRIIIRHRTDHPRGVRTKSRTERIVDLRDNTTLQSLSDYVMNERPKESTTTHVFLRGGRGQRRNEPLSYHALAKMFERHCTRLGIRAKWVTPHALRHTHATQMWDGGMRELALQKRLGHASPESTRIYTRVSDSTVVAEYCRALGQKDAK